MPLLIGSSSSGSSGTNLRRFARSASNQEKPLLTLFIVMYLTVIIVLSASAAMSDMSMSMSGMSTSLWGKGTRIATVLQRAKRRLELLRTMRRKSVFKQLLRQLAERRTNQNQTLIQDLDQPHHHNKGPFTTFPLWEAEGDGESCRSRTTSETIHPLIHPLVGVSSHISLRGGVTITQDYLPVSEFCDLSESDYLDHEYNTHFEVGLTSHERSPRRNAHNRATLGKYIMTSGLTRSHSAPGDLVRM